MGRGLEREDACFWRDSGVDGSRLSDIDNQLCPSRTCSGRRETLPESHRRKDPRQVCKDSKARIMAEEKKRKTSPAEFVNQVRTETSKVVWPTREETIRTAIFVFIMMVVLSLFFLGIDTVFSSVVSWLLTLA